MEVKIKLLNENAIPFKYGSESAAGADIYALVEGNIEIKPKETVMIHTGISMEIPEGYVGLIFARSGLATKRGLAPANKVGVIDSDYRGEIMVSLYNHSDSIQCVENGERIAQISIVPFLRGEFVVADELSSTERGSGGFGSTGTK